MNTIQDVIFDTNYSQQLPNGGKPNYILQIDAPKKTGGVGGIFDSLFGTLFPSAATPKKDGTPGAVIPENSMIKDKDLKEQIKYLLELPDDQYSDSKLTSKLRQYIVEVEKQYISVINDYKSHIAPSFWEHKPNHFNTSGLLGKSYYVQSYPSYIDALWTRDILSFHAKWDMSWFIYPEDDAAIQSMLKTRATQLKAEIKDAMSKGITLDTEVEQQYKDVEMIREKLTTREERYFETGYYMNVYEESEDKLKEEGKKLEQKISGYGIRMKNATQRMDEGFTSTLPLCIDDLGITRSSVTSSLAGSFPFISNDMISETGILYGVNQHTGGLVIFDRFNSKLPNMNSCVLATSGAGKSFTVKLEVLRYLLNGIDIIIIDPENEYKTLAQKVGGTYVNIATSSQQFINPFDIPPQISDVDYGKGDLLRSQIMALIGLVKLLIGDLSTEEEALLDKAIQSTYSLKGFSLEAMSYEGKQPPLMEDLMNVLDGMDGGEKIALKLSKYVTGTFGKLFNNYTNVDINNAMTVFSIRDLEEVLKTPAMFNVLNFIWTKVRSQKKKRLLICDEAWIMLQHETSAEFLFGLIKRARKYGLGITTISQDIEDFVRSKYGKPILSNSSLQILLKQSTTSIKALNDLLGLSEAEQRRLVSCGVGEGLIFAGQQHVGVKVLASPTEKEFITTDVK
ncbi:hypothetical protein P148_SR1C00001G0269 [candidate division SR1 bacterium RAAC1_SR1_1]|nr:hypothetical protein P148_SR1C00001G0269 [candidate division SR1 bacterium RAAC1_SR1_1]